MSARGGIHSCPETDCPVRRGPIVCGRATAQTGNWLWLPRNLERERPVEVPGGREQPPEDL
jgi:hypothetical protein